MGTSLIVGERDTVSLPADLCERYALSTGDPLTVIDLNGYVIVVPKESAAEEMAAQLSELREAAELKVEDLLEGLEDQRRRLSRERYGSALRI